jgi:polyisoprenoid-binding protein YceI
MLAAASLVWPGPASAQEYAINVRQSVITVRVYKSGLFSALGHDHEITAPIGGGIVNTAVRQVELHIKANSLRVRDVEASEKDRNEIQRIMQGPEVLDIEHYPEILFRSNGAEPTGTNSWRVPGNLTLHGQTRPVVVQVKKMDGHYMGASRFKQTDFGIKPIKTMGSTVQVKDEIRIEFDIQLTG